MRKLTFLCTLFLLFLSGKMSADNLRFDPDTQQNNPLPGNLSESNQYTWTSPTITAPTGFTTLRISFIQTYNNAVSSSDYPYVCISEFYLYDKNKNQVTLSADNFSTNAQQSGEGPMAEICDGITATTQESPNYWHSTWSAKVGAHHYLEVTMPEGEYDLSEFSIKWITRAQAGAPKEIVVTTGSSHEDVTAQAAPRNIIYEYTYTPAGGTEQVWLREPIADCIPTSKLPTPTKRAYGITNTTLVNNGYVPEDNESHAYKVTCTLSDSYPFQFADSYVNIEHWYSLRLTKEKKYLRYDVSDTYIPVNETLIPEDADIQAYTWGFVGNPYTGFQIYNLASGEQKILSSSTTMNGETDGTTYPLLTDISVPEGYNTHWDVTESSHLPKGFFLGQHGFGNNRINNRGGKVAYWVGGADAGSTVLATEIAKNSYEILFQQAVDALTAPLDVLKYTPALCTAEDFAAVKQQVTNTINTYAPITTDKTTVQAAIAALSGAEASAAIDAALSQALKGLVNNKYVTLCNVQHPTDYLTINGESSGVTTVADKTALWQLKVQDKQVTLYHVESKRYMGDLPNENSVSVPTSDQTAGLYYLIPTPDQTENVVSFVQDLSAGTTAWGLHDNGYSKIVRWYANTQGTQWTIDAKDVTVPQLAALADNHYMIYHTDKDGVEHYLQIDPKDGTLSLTTTPTYSFLITKEAALTGGHAEYAYYLTMNGRRISHWNGTTFNTNKISTDENATDEQKCIGLWHCQVLYRNINNNSTYNGKYSIRCTNATGKDYNQEYYMAVTADGQLSSMTPENETDETQFQWEIRSGYPFNLSPDANDPNAYAIKSGRDNDNKEWWYTYTNEGKIALTQFINTNEKQYWFFKEIKDNGNYYLQLYPFAGEGKVISYNNTNRGTDRVSGQDANAAEYNNKWFFISTNGNAPYGLQTSGRETYLSNHTGVGSNMGFYNVAPNGDTGTAMYFTAFSNPNIEWWAGLCGTELGQYNGTNIETAISNINGATRAAAYFNAKDALYAAMNTESINKPTAGFYRFKGKATGNYWDATIKREGNRIGMVALDNCDKAGCIFYLNNDKKVLSYSDGTYFQESYAVGAIGADNAAANSITFNSSEGNNYGYYTLRSNYSGSNYLFDNPDRGGCVDRNGSYANNNCDWTIEKVDALPVTIKAAGWSTFCAPVALTIPQGMTVYYANTEEKNGTVAVKPLTDVIPANLPVLLQAEPKEYMFNISSTEVTVPADVNSELMGTPAGKLGNVTENTTYVLTVLKSTGNVGFARNNTGVMPGFKAYLQPAATASEEYSISFSDIADGIQSVNAREQQNTEYYDLSGRRVFFPTRGIYVTNKGEKVFIK
ncbi:MAG: hypothetical protein J6B92_06075 [Paraprevotella sp.]|nr:hypothetical protein [Paraprevotella sp.]